MTEKAGHTAGPWHVGHFADDSHSCNCTGILSECYMGSVAQVTIGNGLPVAAGGNDGPPLEEAKANGRLIAAAPDMLDALRQWKWALDNADQQELENAHKSRDAAIAKAIG